MNTHNARRISYKLTMFVMLLFGSTILLVVPNLLESFRRAQNSEPIGYTIGPINKPFWNELNETRSIVQIELNDISNSSIGTSSNILTNDAQLHFRTAMTKLPYSVRSLPALREIHAGIANDLELLQEGKGIIKELVAKQIINDINLMEKLIRSQGY
ncbi:hypothetical protein [Paludibacterium denitrificans]|uniref:Uncharacterized protein n=1 Tax=Paludibacterium denitrificans TaxID=2675226 RepID=A0A844GH74_9NEIS|nr:hypothetical protein [Paludibacterium denitrificans]MTD34237.1 hypothetical protein [Paludibacterium denitrificans]